LAAIAARNRIGCIGNADSKFGLIRAVGARTTVTTLAAIAAR
jgi:hypothetical protein